MKNLHLLLIAVAAAALFICTGCASFADPHPEQAVAPATTLCILHTNDHHGHPLSFSWPPAQNAGGLPARAIMIAEVRQAWEHVLVLDAGDLNTGRPESDFFDAEPDIIGYNSIGYQAMAVGNHEFDHPPEIRKEQEELSAFPWLSANIVTSEGKPVFTPYIIEDMDGLKVAVLGLTTKETAQVGNPEFIGNVSFLDEVETARRYMPTLKEQADIVIGLVHMGLYDDWERGSARLARHVPGFDLIIDGHTHTMMEAPRYVNGTPIVMAHKWGLVVGLGLMRIKEDRVCTFVWDAVPINLQKKIQAQGQTEQVLASKPYPDDPELLAKLKLYAQKVEKKLGTVIGRAQTTLSSRMVRRQETALGNLVADSMAWYARRKGADFAVQNGGGIRADLPEGTITMRRAYEILPFDNSVVLVSMTGRDVLELFNTMAGISPGDGGFPQVSAGVRLLLNQDTGKCQGA